MEKREGLGRRPEDAEKGSVGGGRKRSALCFQKSFQAFVGFIHFSGKVFPVAGLKVLDTGMDHPVPYRLYPLFIPGDAVEREHDEERLVAEFLQRGEDILPPGVVGVFSRGALSAEDDEQSADARPQGINGAAVIYKKGTGRFPFMSGKPVLQGLPEGSLQFFDGIPVDARQFEGIDRDIRIGTATIAAALSAGDRPVMLPFGPLDGDGGPFIKGSKAFEEQREPGIADLVCRESQAV